MNKINHKSTRGASYQLFGGFWQIFLRERPEAVDAGIVKLVETNKETIIQETQLLLDSHEAYQSMSKAHDPYSDGFACEKIVNFTRHT